MKIRNRVIALALTIFTVLAMVPFGALAAEPWLSVEGESTGAASADLTVTLDAENLLELLKNGGASGLSKKLKSGVSVSGLSNVFTLEELFEIIPKEALLNLFDINAIIDQIGVDVLLGFLEDDMDAILNAADKNALVDLIFSAAAPEDIVDFAAILGAGALDSDVIRRHLDTEALKNSALDMSAIAAELESLRASGALDADSLADAVDLLGVMQSGLIDVTDLCDADTVIPLLSGKEGEVAAYVDTTVAAGILESQFELTVDDAQGYYNTATSTWDFVGLMRDKAGLTSALVNGGAIEIADLLNNGVVSLNDVLDPQTAIAALTALPSAKAAQLKNYVDTAEMFSLIGTDRAIALAGGYSVALGYIDLDALLNDPDVDPQAMINTVTAGGTALMDLVDIDALTSQVSSSALMEVIPTDLVFGLLTTEELTTIVSKINIKQYVTPLLTLATEKISSNVTFVSVDGNAIAEQADDGVLYLNLQNIVNTALNLLPVLDSFAAGSDSTVYEAQITLKYIPDGTAAEKTKNIHLTIALGGGVEKIRALAEQITQYVNFAADGNTLSATVKTPALLMSLVKRAISSDKLPDTLRDKILTLSSETGSADASVDDVFCFLQELTLGELIEVLEQIDPEEVYASVMQVSYVQTLLLKVKQKTGKDLTNIDLSGLVDKAVHLPKINDIANFVYKKAHVNIINDLLALADEYKLNDGVYDIGGLYSELLDRAELRSGVFAKVQNKIGALANRLPASVLGKKISSIYEGNGQFVFSGEISFDAKKVLDLVIDKASGLIGRSVSTDVKNLFYQFLADDAAVTVGLDADVTLNGLYRLTYENEAGDVLFTAFLPKGTVPSGMNAIDTIVAAAEADYPTGYTADDSVVYWYDKEDTTKTEVDLSTYAVTGDATLVCAFAHNEYTVTMKNGTTVLGTLTVEHGQTVDTAEDYATVIASAEALKPTDTATETYEIYWYEEDDTAKTPVTLTTYTVTSDVTLVCDFKPVPVTYTVTFKSATDTLGTLDVAVTDAIDETTGFDAILASAMLGKPADTKINTYTIYWYVEGDTAKTPVDFDTYSLTADVTLVCDFEEDYFLTISTSDEGGITATITENNGEYVVTIQQSTLPTEFVLDLDRAHMLKHASEAEDTVKLRVSMNGAYDLITISGKVLKALYQASTASANFTFQAPAATPASFAGSIYDGITAADFYSFSLGLDGTSTYDTAFDGGVQIKLPFTGAISNSLTQRTSVYVMENSTATAVTPVITAGYVGFAAPHFSDYVIVNEALVNIEVVSADGETVVATLTGLDNGAYYPIGMSVTLTPNIPDTDYILDKMEYQIGSGSYTDYSTAFSLTDTANIRINVKRAMVDFYIYYYVNGALYHKVSYNNYTELTNLELIEFPTDVTVPAGYTNGSWIGYDAAKLMVADLYVFATWQPITYTVRFVAGDTTLDTTLTFTAQSYDLANLQKLAPSVPFLAGKAGTWDWTTAGLGTSFAAPAEATVTVNADYDAVIFRISGDGTVTVAETSAAGQPVSVTMPAKDGYLPAITVVTEDGDAVTVDGLNFVMPNANVIVTGTYVAQQLNYSINGNAGTANAGDAVTFTVTVPAGKYVSGIPAGCALVSSETLDDGALRLVYSFVAGAGVSDVSYEVQNIPFTTVRILNGAPYTDSTDPVPADKNVRFAGWSEAAFNSFSFARFEKDPAEKSLLWLWILLIVLAVILIIALLYVLYINEILKPNFFLRAIVWIVGLFFALCIGLYKIALGIAGLFGYKHRDEAKEAPEGEEANG